MNTDRTRAGRRLVPGLLVAALLTLPACDLDKLLEVDIPGKVDADKLADPALATVLVNSVVGDTECSWSNYMGAASHHSDEWMPASGNLNMREWGQRKMGLQNSAGGVLATGDCGGNYGIYTPLQTARFQSNDVYNKLAEFDVADVPDKAMLQGKVRVFGGWSLIALGEGFCSMAIDGGPELQPADVFALAVTDFTEGIGGAVDPDLVALAYAGRARAKLDLSDWAGAIADAQQVPDGFDYEATRGDAIDVRFNGLHRWVNESTGGFGRNATVADDFRELTVNPAGELTQGDGVADPRVPVMTIDQQAFDFSTIHWFTTKYTSRGDGAPITSWEAAQLIIAEASAQLNDLPTAVGVINDLRTRAGLPTWAAGGGASQDEVLTAVLAERRRELFAEQGFRFNDMLRYRGTPQEIPFLGEPGSIHPDGLDQTGLEYGDITCWELPLVETAGNPNIG